MRRREFIKVIGGSVILWPLGVRAQNWRMTKRRRTPRVVIEAYEAGDDEALRALLDLKPWEVSPLDADGLCPYSPTSAGTMSWAKAAALREELERASTAARKW